MSAGIAAMTKVVTQERLIFREPEADMVVIPAVEGEMGVLQVEKKIRNRVKRQMEKTQREYYLNEQMKAIQRELGDQDDGRDELIELSQDHLSVSVKQKPFENAANKRIIELVAAHFGVAAKSVHIIRGHHAPSKILSIN